MRWQRFLKFSSLAALGLMVSACGVKGDPLPPERPVEMGRGRPTYRKATEGIRIDKTRPTERDETEESERE